MKATMRFFCLAVVFLLARQSAFAQGAATGDLHVVVKDPKGSVVTNATVTVRDAAKGLERAGTGDGQGGYSARQLPPGMYSVTVETPGFAKAEANGVAITVGGIVDLPVTLTIAGGKEVVEVSTQAELVETSRSSTTDTIGERRIDNLPINGRNYIQFTLTDSQVSRDDAPNTGAAPTSGLNMSGQRARSNLVNVDGADATDNSTNGVRSTVSQEDVQEFQIISNSYAAEYGRAAGGVVNIITRSGSNDFHGDAYGYLRNRDFQAVNPFAVCLTPPCPNPPYTRVQAGTAFGGPVKKDKTYYYFSYEVTRRHETGFSSIGQGDFDLVPFNTATGIGSGPGGAGAGSFPLPFGTIVVDKQTQLPFLQSLTAAQEGAYAAALPNYVAILGASSGQAVQGTWPTALVQGLTGGALSSWSGFPPICLPPGPCAPVPASFQTLAQQIGNFPVFEGTSLYAFRIDHNVSNNNRLTLRVNASPSTITGIEVNGQDQPFGQNAYSRTSQQTYRDVAGVVQDTWTLGGNKVNDFLFQYARRGLAYFYNTQIPGGSDPAINITGYAYFGREPYSYIQRVENRYQFKDSFGWSIGRHDMKFGGDFDYIPITATFTVNYGGVYDFASFPVTPFGFPSSFPGFSPVQAYGAGLPEDLIQGIGNPHDSFSNKPLGVFWQDSWRVRHNFTLNYGVRYDLEFPPKLTPLQGLAIPAYGTLGLQKGIQTDTNNIQPRIGIAWDPKGDGKTVIRGSFGMFYDHPLLGLYFLGDASDGSTSGQLAILGTGPCSNPNPLLGNPGNLNAIPIFQGLPINSTSGPCAVSSNSAVVAALNYNPSQQRFSCPSGNPSSCGLATPSGSSGSIFLTQNYLNPSSFMPLAFQPFGYPQAKNFVYAYSQQANLTFEHDLGGGYALSLAYNFNGGRHLNRPINANTIRGDLMTANYVAALKAGNTASNPYLVTGCGPGYVDASLMNFFRPGGLNPSIAAFYQAIGMGGCVSQAEALIKTLPGFNSACNPTSPAGPYTGCVPFSDMDANYSNGTSVYHGLSANLRKRFTKHYEFLASYTWSHSIDDSTDLQATLTPQDSYIPGADRSSSTFDQRHRFVFSGVYQSGKLSGSGFVSKVFSNWTFAPQIEVGAGRPFNVLTGNADNLQFSPLTGRPNTFVNATCTALGNPQVNSKYSPTGVFQEPCIAEWNGKIGLSGLASLDGNLGRNAGITPWTIFNDVRFAKRIAFSERYNMDFIADMFNIANRYNVAAVNPLFSSAGQATAAYDPRQFQFALKLNW
jgi:hypothetical protein